jgi:hypothetical protein
MIRFMSLALFRAALLSYNDTPESLTKEILETMGKMYAWFPQLAETIDTVLENHKVYLLKEQEKLRVYDTIIDDVMHSSNIVFGYDPAMKEETKDLENYYYHLTNGLFKFPKDPLTK